MKCRLWVIILLLVRQSAFAQDTILWKVSDTTNKTESYILGTFHQFGNSFVDSIPEIKKALLNSELAVFESIDKVADTRQMIERRQSSVEIEKTLQKKDFEKLKEIASGWRVDLYKLKPIEIRWKLQQEFQRTICKTTRPTDTFDHFDSYLIHMAEKNNIETYGLETDSLQLALIQKEYKNTDWKKEKKHIRYWIRQMTRDKPDLEACDRANKYRVFNIDYEFKKECECDVLLFQRNNEWMEIIPNLLREKNIFIAVGYFHLKRKCGILEQLRARGFILEQVELDLAARTM